MRWKPICMCSRLLLLERDDPRHSGLDFWPLFYRVRKLKHLKQDLKASVVQDYDTLKEEILSWSGLTKFSMAQRNHNWSL